MLEKCKAALTRRFAPPSPGFAFPAVTGEGF